jgi:penicillin-binding protein 1A
MQDDPFPQGRPLDPARVGRSSTALRELEVQRRARMAQFDAALAEFDLTAGTGAGATTQLGNTGGFGAPPPPPPPAPPVRSGRPRWLRWTIRLAAAGIILLVLAIAWLALTAPLSKSLQPPLPPSITLLSAEGKPIAQRGANIGKPVDAAKLPKHVTQAFIAVEDRRFYSHWGIDPRGILRAMVHNTMSGGVREGGSTITQQLAKNAFLDSDRTAARKLREVMIAFWLEAWLTKDEILSRYLSNVYFGDNAYGIAAASQHYFSRKPQDLNTAQAAMLAGLVKAPSRLAPTGNLKGARARQAVVVSTMKAAGFLTPAEAEAVQPARLRVAKGDDLPSGTYFADWVLPAARDRAGGVGTDLRVTTTLESRVQRAAERAVRRAGLRQTQVALVAMHPDGRVIAMIGGKNYKDSPFNRAVQARRQPGSTFKLFVYLAALRSGLSPDSPVQDEPLTIGDWSPKNSDGRYLGTIPLTRAFARSSNVASARLTQEVGVRNVIRAARDLGISTAIPNEATIALGTANVSLLELTAAYAAIAAGEAPVRPHGLAQEEQTSWFERLRNSSRPLGRRELDGMRELLAASIRGTGHQANLPIEAFGKTGTTQDSRDALFVGYAGDIVAGVWLGNDDNTPNPGLAGGGLPARIWRDFMTEALGVPLPPPPPEVNENLDEAVDNSVDLAGDALDEADAALDEARDTLEDRVQGLGLNLRLDRDGGILVDRGGGDRRGPPPPPEPDARRFEEDEE